MIERAILEAGRRLRERGEPYVIATVVQVRGSAYRRPGARMLVTRGGWIAGSVSGGCLEGDVTRRAWWLTEQRPAIVTYDSRISDDDSTDELRVAFGVGCGGIVDVLLERAAAALDVLALADAWSRDQRAGAVATVLDRDRLAARHALADDGTCHGDPPPAVLDALAHAIATGETRHRTIDGVAMLVESIRPAPRLFVFGAGHDVVPVVAFARRLGWEVIVSARHATHAVRERFAAADALDLGHPRDLAATIDASHRALGLVMSHDFDADRASLDMLLASRAEYIGVLGPRTRTERLLDGRPRDPRLHAPVGLELGAETPDEIALSIVSEIQATLNRMPATRLREHLGPIHVNVS